MVRVVDSKKVDAHFGPDLPATRWLEIALIFAMFFIIGGAPPSHHNESHYLCKAKHYWQADWCAGNMFLESADAHLTFYWTIGWLTRWFSLPTVAWIGRVLAWGLLAWAWQRLAHTVVSRPLYGVLAAALFLTLVSEANFAGEWIVGGVEAKCFAYVFVLLGLKAVANANWRRCWPLFGLASALHPVVGGWSVIAAAVVWLTEPVERRLRITAMMPALMVGGLLALPGLLPALTLTHGQSGDAIDEARQIYVFDRLPHHLALLSMKSHWLIERAIRHGTMLIGFFLACRYLRVAKPGANFKPNNKKSCLNTQTENLSRLIKFACATIGLSICGLLIELILWNNHALAARLLRFYWFRLADIAVPLATSLAIIFIIADLVTRKSQWALPVLMISMLGPGWLLLSTSADRLHNPCPPGESKLKDYVGWQQACKWAGEHTPAHSQFLTPRFGQTFMWHAQRPDVVNWKDIPQNVAGIIQWRDRYARIHYQNWSESRKAYRSLADQGTERIGELAREFHASHVITLNDPPLQLPKIYENETYAIYATPESLEPKTESN